MTDHMTTDEAAKALGISPLTLRNWRASRRNLDYLRKGRRVYYRRQDIERFLLTRVTLVVASH